MVAGIWSSVPVPDRVVGRIAPDADLIIHVIRTNRIFLPPGAAFHRLMVPDEQNWTALMVAHGCPASSSRRMWARSRTSGSADRR
jgi:hypothetical protein